MQEYRYWDRRKNSK